MLDDILLLVAGLSGLGGLVSIIVNILKLVGVVKDGASETWFQILNLLAFIGVAVVYFMRIEVNWGQVDNWLMLLAAFLGYIAQIMSGKLTYKTIGGKAPVIGYSYSESKS